MSMQEELAARRAASEGETGSAQQPKRAFEAAPKRLFNPPGTGAKKRLRNISAESKQRRQNRTLRGGQAGFEIQSLGDAFGHFEASPAKTNAAFSFKMLFLILGISAVIICGILFLMGLLSSIPYDDSLPPEDPTVPTFRGADPGGSLSEDSGLVEITAYVEEHTEPLANPDRIFDSAYLQLSDLYEQKGWDFNWYASDGRLYYWPKCERDVDLSEENYKWASATNTIKGILRNCGLEETPVIFALETAEGYDLKLLMIDGVRHYPASGSPEDAEESE